MYMYYNVIMYICRCILRERGRNVMFTSCVCVCGRGAFFGLSKRSPRLNGLFQIRMILQGSSRILTETRESYPRPFGICRQYPSKVKVI